MDWTGRISRASEYSYKKIRDGLNCLIFLLLGGNFEK
jgi:hypothetical protein